MLKTKHPKLSQPSKKLSEKCIGPYSIVEIKSSNAVQLKLLRVIKIHSVVNISHVHLYKPSCIPQQTTPEPPPVEIEGEFITCLYLSVLMWLCTHPQMIPVICQERQHLHCSVNFVIVQEFCNCNPLWPIILLM